MAHDLEWCDVEEFDNSSTQIIHYYDEYGQEFIPGDDGLHIRTKKVPEGQWNANEWGENKLIAPLDPRYSFIRTDHPVNGTVHGCAINGDHELEYFRYQYMMDISAIVNDWSTTYVSDSPIVDADITVQNISNDLFAVNSSMFLPGSRVDFSSTVGDDKIQMSKLYVDEVSFNVNEDGVSLSLRNQIGYLLKDQTCDNLTELTGTIDEVVNTILQAAGCNAAAVQTFEGSYTFNFEPSDTFLDAIETISEFLVTEVIEDDVILAEQPGGALIFGTQSYLESYIQNSYYFFNGDDDVFTRGYSKNADVAYSAIMVSGDGMDDEPLIPKKVEIETWDNWGGRKHKTCHIDAPCKMTQSGLNAWAEATASAYALMGLTESFEMPFTPQLLPGDLATIDNGVSQQKLGLVTEITHSFSRTKGFTTKFTVDSGGVYTDEESVKVYSRTAKVNGLNRKQSMVDAMKILLKK